VKPSSLRILRF